MLTCINATQIKVSRYAVNTTETNTGQTTSISITQQKLTDPSVGHETNEVLRWQRLKHWNKELDEMIILTELAVSTLAQTHTTMHQQRSLV